jgi:hypothetical protein
MRSLSETAISSYTPLTRLDSVSVSLNVKVVSAAIDGRFSINRFGLRGRAEAPIRTTAGAIMDDEEKYLQWQERAITQLGIAINLLLTFAGITLEFALRHRQEFSRWEHPAPVLLALSIGAALMANVTRVWDFRYTRRAAWARWKKDESTHDKAKDKADCFGVWTWGLFTAQAIAFALGVSALIVSLW